MVGFRDVTVTPTVRKSVSELLMRLSPDNENLMRRCYAINTIIYNKDGKKENCFHTRATACTVKMNLRGVRTGSCAQFLHMERARDKGHVGTETNVQCEAFIPDWWRSVPLCKNSPEVVSQYKKKQFLLFIVAYKRKSTETRNF